MKKIAFIFCLVLFVSNGFAGDANDVNTAIEKLNQAVSNLRYLTANIEYTHSQPLFDTQTIRKGKLFYIRDANTASLRINFESLKQDQAQEQQYREEYIFDGWKLTRIDYQSKSAVTEQYSKDKAIEPFELVQDYFPIIGLTKPQEMKQDFDIGLDENTLKLSAKENSRFAKTYKQVAVTIEPDTNLPVAFAASTTEDEQITIKLTGIDTSSKIKKEVFEVSLSADFTQTQK